MDFKKAEINLKYYIPQKAAIRESMEICLRKQEMCIESV